MVPPAKSPTQFDCQRPTIARIRGSATGSSGGGRIAATNSGSTRNSTASIWAPPKRGAPIAASIRATSAAVLRKPTSALRGQLDRDRVAEAVGQGDAEAL